MASKFRGSQVAFNPTYFGITATSDTAGRWTANIEDIKEYYDGLRVQIVLKTSYNSTYNTLDINGLGQALVWYRIGSRLTSHFGAGSILSLTYYSGAGTYSTFTGGWVIDSAYLDGVESYTNRYNYFAPLSSSNGMPAYKLWAFDVNGNAQPFTITAGTGTTKVINTCVFRLSTGIFWNGYTSSVAANARIPAAYQHISVSTSVLNYTHNGISSPLAYKPFYLKAKIGTDQDTFTLDNSSYTSFLTQTLPTTDDGFIYIYVGMLYDNANSFILEPYHPIYYYQEGALRLFNTSYISGDSHNHDYNLLANLPVIYNANHDGVPSDDFDTLYNYQNDVWLCSHSMCNAPLDNEGNNNASYNKAFDNCVIQQFGNKDAGTKIQVLYITTGHVANLSMGYIFYRMQGDKWKRIATYSDIAALQTQIDSLVNTFNSKQDKRSIITDINIPSNGSVNINPSANKVQYINLSGQTTTYTINLNYLNSLDEYTMVITNPNNAGRLVININSSYKFVGVMPSWSFNSWVICIWRGMIFANILN